MAMKKQFIAGAVCPSCGQQDTIALYIVDAETSDGVQSASKHFECINCGHQERMISEDEQASTQTRPQPARIPIVTLTDKG
jgi:uncharacterized metal-binding protein (TIGR02443 family)